MGMPGFSHTTLSKEAYGLSEPSFSRQQMVSRPQEKIFVLKYVQN